MFVPLNDNKVPLLFAANYDYGNFGDLLSRYLVEVLSGREVIKYSCKKPMKHFSAIGSILTRREICSSVVVWGAGFLSPQPIYKIRLEAIRQYIRGAYGKPIFLAVRGKKSQSILNKAGFDCPNIYGDPALLLPKIYKPKELEKKYSVGVVLHWVHEKISDFLKNDENLNVLKIPIERDYNSITTFIDEIMSCDVILSSSLHGLIIANAYKKPCVRLIIDGNSIHSKADREDFKFDDYLSGLNDLSSDGKVKNYNFAQIKLSKNQLLNKELVDRIISLGSVPEFDLSLEKLLAAFPYKKSCSICN